jgi:hypothetical protein
MESLGQDDGTPTRQPCTNQFGSAMSGSSGRLDGFLVAVLPPGTRGCNGDAHHVHLQIKSKSQIFDVAVNVDDSQSNADIDFLSQSMSLPGSAWAEGWHGSESLDYTQIGLASGDFSPLGAAELAQTVASALENANHISVFMTPYGPGGGHDIHRHPTTTDGAIVIDPLSETAQLLAFHFDNQTF